MGGAPVSYGAFSLPSLMNPDIVVQQQQTERQQALVDAMRQQSMTPVLRPADGGAVWAQGLAKLGQALVAGISQRNVDKRTQALANTLRDRMGMNGAFGQPGSPATSADGATPRFGGGSNAGGTMSLSSNSGGGDPLSAPVPPAPPAGSPPQQAPAQPDPSTASPPAQQPPPQPSPAAGTPSWQRGPLSVSDNPVADQMEFYASPDKYWEAHNAQIAPTDFAKSLRQAGIDPNSPLGHQIMQQQVAKQNHMPLENARGGSWSTDPTTGAKTYNPQLPEGAEPVFNAQGQPVGVRMLDGTVQAIAAVEGAKAGSRAAAQAPYDLVTVTDAQGNTFQVPKSSIPGVGGQGGGAPTGGSLNNFYHGGGAPGAPSSPAGAGNQSGVAPGTTAANVEAGRNSANGFNAAINGGNDAKNAMRTINNITSAAQGLPTGPGSELISELKSGVNAAAGAVGAGPVFDRDQIAHFDEMAKNAASLGSQLASSAAGSNGVTDARLANALKSLPGSHYSPQAIQEVGANLKALQAAALARSQAASAWQQQRGANSFPEFQSQWQQAYNPDLFYHLQKGGPAEVGKWAGTMNQADRMRTLQQYRQMKAMGGF